MPGMVLFWELRSVGGAAWRAVGVCLSLFLPLPVQAGEGGAGQAVAGIFCLSFALAAVGGVSVVSGWLRGLEPVWAVADGCGWPLVKNVDKARAVSDSEGRLCGLSFGRRERVVNAFAGTGVPRWWRTCAGYRADLCSPPGAGLLPRWGGDVRQPAVAGGYGRCVMLNMQLPIAVIGGFLTFVSTNGSLSSRA